MARIEFIVLVKDVLIDNLLGSEVLYSVILNGQSWWCQLAATLTLNYCFPFFFVLFVRIYFFFFVFSLFLLGFLKCCAKPNYWRYTYS